MKILVTGGKGQLAYELKNLSLKKNNFYWFFSDRESFDISDLDNIYIYLDIFNPSIIINCAAYTFVDRAEDNFEIANIVNHKAVCLIAKWCNENNCKLLHISTDYVFDGNSMNPFTEIDKTNPLNNYGKSKLLGDLGCLKHNPKSIIIRTSWLYCSFGKNFVTNLIKLSKNNHKIQVVNDQFGAPTYAADLAKTIIEIINNIEWCAGIYNYSNSGNISWYEFANEIKSVYGFNSIIKPISSKNFIQKAKRPKYSILDNSKIRNTFNIKQINYLNSLKKCIKIIKNES